jgi:endonuclease III
VQRVALYSWEFDNYLKHHIRRGTSPEDMRAAQRRSTRILATSATKTKVSSKLESSTGVSEAHQSSDPEDAMQELMSYKYTGPKSASVVMGWCLKRNRFTVNVHIYRIAGLWGWISEKATRELTQSHLDAVVPSELKFMLHFLILQHGRECPTCRGGARKNAICEAQKKIRQKRK